MTQQPSPDAAPQAVATQDIDAAFKDLMSANGMGPTPDVMPAAAPVAEDATFTAEDVAFLEKNGMAARVQTAEEQAVEAERRRLHREQFAIGQLVTARMAELAKSDEDDE